MRPLPKEEIIELVKILFANPRPWTQYALAEALGWTSIDTANNLLSGYYEMRPYQQMQATRTLMAIANDELKPEKYKSPERAKKFTRAAINFDPEPYQPKGMLLKLGKNGPKLAPAEASTWQQRLRLQYRKAS